MTKHLTTTNKALVLDQKILAFRRWLRRNFKVGRFDTSLAGRRSPGNNTIKLLHLQHSSNRPKKHPMNVYLFLADPRTYL